jgi:hypothetical protein
MIHLIPKRGGHMSNAEFNVAYCGQALDDNAMDVRDLAPALLAVGGACERANAMVNGQKVQIAVNVKAGFKPGSFEILMSLAQTLSADQTTILLANAEQLLKVLGLVGSGLVGAIALVVKLKGGKPDKVTNISNNSIAITINGCTFNTTPQALNISQDPVFKSNMHKALSPLNRNGIDRFSYGPDSIEKMVIGKSDVEFFNPPDITEDVPYAESEATMAYEVFTPQPGGGNYKWRFAIGGGDRFTATMADEKFMAKVEAGEIAFRNGDIAKINLRTRAWKIPGGGLKTEHTVLEVIEYLPRDDAPPQLPF